MPLAPEIAAFLEAQKGQPPRSALDAAATRARMRAANALAGTPAQLPRIDDLVLPNGVSAREYWPSSNGNPPVLVYFHGGRFFSGDLESHDTLCRALAVASGWRVLAVDYRLAPEHPFPAALQDACAAVRWARERGGNAAVLAVAGDSAGANLAAGAARRCRDSRLLCQVLVYPMIDATCELPSHAGFATGYGPGTQDMARGWVEYLEAGVDVRDPDVSPRFARDLAGLPPALVLTAEFDTLRDEGEEYAHQLRAAEVPVRLHRFDGMIHGFVGMAAITEAASRAIEEIGGFLREFGR